MVPVSNLSLGKTQTLKTVILLQRVQWPGWKVLLYHNSRKHEPLKFMRFISVGERLGLLTQNSYYCSHTSIRPPGSIPGVGWVRRNQTNQFMTILKTIYRWMKMYIFNFHFHSTMKKSLLYWTKPMTWGLYIKKPVLFIYNDVILSTSFINKFILHKCPAVSRMQRATYL